MVKGLWEGSNLFELKSEETWKKNYRNGSYETGLVSAFFWTVDSLSLSMLTNSNISPWAAVETVNLIVGGRSIK